MFKRKPKKLNLRQVHELHLLLKHCLPEKDEELLIDQVEYVLNHSIPGTMIASLEIMYNKVPKDVNALQALAMFLSGLHENNFFAYVDFLRRLRG